LEGGVLFNEKASGGLIPPKALFLVSFVVAVMAPLASFLFAG
jgi:hypothetical protein